MLFIAFVTCLISALVLTPLVKLIAYKIGATDKPNQRKVHQKVMPRLGGLAIYLAFIIGMIILMPSSPFLIPILIGATIIVVIGVFDDLYELSPKIKFSGQLLAAGVVIFMGDIQVNFLNLPFDLFLPLGILAIPFTFIWITGVTNAINLIDGLDGLAAGVSAIVLSTISVISYSMDNYFVLSVSLLLLASILGFLVFNFYPASIFMGDTGALFLGFMISVLSLLGYKNVTFISFLVPIIILGVPIADTLFAIVRRLVQRKPLSAPDKSHLHHCLMRLGYSHRKTVLIIYGISIMFGVAAIMYTKLDNYVSFFVIVALIIIVELIVERIGLIADNYRPIINFINQIRYDLEKKKAS